MKIKMPTQAAKVIQKLEQHGFEAYIVGGCVRDSILGRTPGDWDITTSASPQEVKEIFDHTVDTGIEHGTVTVLMNHEPYEVTTYRVDGKYEDHRRPNEVHFTKSLREDLLRRDFTINAMAYNDSEGIIDMYDGMTDLKNQTIRCVGEAKKRFDEDALRILRALRFQAQLGFQIEEKTEEAIKNQAKFLKDISAERIQVELEKLITSAHPEVLVNAYKLGVTKIIFPEFDIMMETPQNNPHHCYSVGEHTLHALMEIQADKVARITMLLHDVAKPMCRTTDEHGVDHFYGHPQEGSLVARKILRRLKFDNDTTDRVCRLILCHDDNPPLQERAVRRAIYRNGVDQYPLLFAVKRADMLAQSAYRREEKTEYLKEYEEIYEQIMAKRQCLSIKELAVTGTDLIADGMQPGKAIGETLKQLLEHVLEHPEDNTKEKLMEQVHNIASPHI